MTAALPYPTAPAAALAGQTDAKDATGRIDAIEVAYTAAGAPVVIVDPAGPIWLVVASNHWTRRALWWVGGEVQQCAAACRRMAFTHVELVPHAAIDETLQGDATCY